MQPSFFQIRQESDFDRFLEEIFYQSENIFFYEKFFRFFSAKILRNSYFCIKILLLYIAIFL